MPEGWVMSRTDGAPITDPARINEGTYLPMAGYKGSGLSIVIGLLAGPLNRAAFGRDVRDFAAPEGSAEPNVGQFVVALDVARFLPLNAFKAEIDRHVRDLASSRPLPGGDIRVPGQGRLARRAERERNGVPLSTALLAQVDEVAKSLAIAPLSARG